jgi:hypothetical protein
MADYLQRGDLQPRGDCIVYVRRTTQHSGLRQGLVWAVDLEQYDYVRESRSLIRATEGTIVHRIPPRLAVRRPAPLELPHIMVLLNDPEREVIERWSEQRDELELLYDVELMQQGGKLQGYCIDRPEHIERIVGRLETLLDRTRKQQQTHQPLFWAMGDGNHSLATAKASWEEVKREMRKAGKGEDEIVSHPARWALAEIVNIHSPGLRFEPIHRAVFTRRVPELLTALRGDEALAEISSTSEEELKDLLAGPKGQDKAGFYDGGQYFAVAWKPDRGLPPALVDNFFRAFREIDPAARIDFIHGWEDCRKLARTGAGCFFLPVLARERLFSYIEQCGPLPRKSFSMGDAEEKRYYMEARQIRL